MNYPSNTGYTRPERLARAQDKWTFQWSDVADGGAPRRRNNPDIRAMIREWDALGQFVARLIETGMLSPMTYKRLEDAMAMHTYDEWRNERMTSAHEYDKAAREHLGAVPTPGDNGLDPKLD